MYLKNEFFHHFFFPKFLCEREISQKASEIELSLKIRSFFTTIECQ